jgi:hypothetical protein
MFIKAIKVHCMSACNRGMCRGCPFEKHSERNRQVALFTERRARITTARRASAQVVH